MEKINPKMILNRIDLSNVDRIGMAGDSYTEGIYYIKGKAWVCRFSELLDYNVESIGEGGITCANLATRIKQNTPRYHATLGWKDFKPTKAMIMSFVNDTATGTSADFEAGMRELIKTIRNYGAEPIVCTEFRKGPLGGSRARGYETGLSAICSEMGVKFWNILDYTTFLNALTNSEGDSGGYINYWNGSHPGTRTGFIILDQYLRKAKELPRPAQSLKIFKKLSTVTVSTLADLVYTNTWSRMKLFKEINIGHSGLINSAIYDDIDSLASNFYERVNSDYLTIMGGGNVSFSDYALVECVLPATRNNVHKVKLNIPAVDTSIYIFKDGVWTEILDGETTDLDGCFDYDKIKFLVYKNGGFNINSISVDWEGIEGKDASVTEPRQFTGGTELLTNNYFLDNTGRTVVGTLDASDAPDGIYPVGCSKIVTVSADNYFKLNIPNDGNIAGFTSKARIRIVARYYPPENDGSITVESFDWAELKLLIQGSTTYYYTSTYYVGTHWTMVEMDIDFPQGTTVPELTVKATNEKPVEIAYISCLKS